MAGLACHDIRGPSPVSDVARPEKAFLHQHGCESLFGGFPHRAPMRFDLTPEQAMVQKMAREFAEQEVAPIAADIDREGRFPHENVKRMADLGLLGVMVPENYGGAGLDTVSYVLALEEIARH